MSDRRTVPIVCARAPRHIVYVPAVRVPSELYAFTNGEWIEEPWWECSWCGARVKVVA